jgi:FRG domain
MQAAMLIEEEFETATEFLEALRITNPRWISKQHNWESHWIFRGQANANWTLLPTAWRSPNLKRFKQKYRPKFEKIHLVPLEVELAEITKMIKRGEITAREGHRKAKIRSEQTKREVEFGIQYFAEMQAVKEFTEFADKLGHPVPGGNEFIVLRQSNYRDLPEEDYLISLFSMWTEYSDPFNVNCSAVALAQHHRVPTRLLDWTENPMIAAFFAAEEFTSNKFADKRRKLNNSRIAVWAISKEIFSGADNNSVVPTPIQLIARPRHEISYLLAQKAVFTRDKEANRWFLNTGKWRSVDEAVGNNPEYLKKITLPVAEVGELLRLLWLEGISRAHLMPTYDNVTRALQTKAWWEDR